MALFFACEEMIHHNKDGALLCMLPTELNKIANVSLNHASELPFLGVEPLTEGYLPSKIAQENTTSLNPIAVTAIRDSARMYAQLGTFTIIHREARSIESLGAGNHVWQWIIPKAKKKPILEELSKLAINRLTLFPELPSVAQLAKEML